MHTRTPLVRTLLVVALLTACSSPTPAPTGGTSTTAPLVGGKSGQGATDGRPNILLVIADDFGIDASPCYEQVSDAAKPDMPTLRSLCASGVVFDNMIVNPECTPTRATLLTGRYGVHTGVGAVDASLPTSEVSIQSVLTEQTNYASAVIGKWHLAGAPAEANTDHVTALGVPHYAGFLSGALQDYYNWPLSADGHTTQQTGYATTVFTGLAIDWIADHQDQPWFTWLAYTAPHTPFHLPPDNLHTRDGLTGDPQDILDRPRDYYFAAAEAMDAELGRLLNSIPQAEREQTTVIFVGDNGTPRQVVQGYSATKSKGTVYEGGVHVPLVVAGAGVTRAGEREPALVNGADVFSTIADLASADVDTPSDSISFTPLLSSGNVAKRDFAYTERFGGTSPNGRPTQDAWAIRDTTHQLIEFANGTTELYDLVADPLETNNLLADPATAQPSAAIVQRLTTAAATLRK